ncbi:MAG: flavodoxin-dependent (E)-4-hydroxy-3-methylbut-2-enyl-diphosphate synthase [Neisseriales bacterium]|nr:MAG: flavodoxin-dependent (E)-4-hydroxy-3-methylbut-2-enyl-diphosphate synthase [Neisseriales bacterium]
MNTSALLRTTSTVYVGSVAIGTGHPVVVQSMTNISTSNVVATVEQIKALSDAGSEMVRLTVDTKAAAQAVPTIRQLLDKAGYQVPLIGDFHFNGDRLLRDCPDCAIALAKYRINPGNVNSSRLGDTAFCFLIEQAIKYDRPIRIGANWGSLDPVFLSHKIEENQKQVHPKPIEILMDDALIQSVLEAADHARQLGLAQNKIILSCKVSQVNRLIAIYRRLAQACSYPLHLGLTEAGLGYSGIVTTTAALTVLLSEGIGETIRVSLTPQNNEPRTTEVTIAQAILQSLDLRRFTPHVTACPGCGRTTSRVFQELAFQVQQYIAQKMPMWKKQYVGVENLQVAVMGCVVNGPGESKLANIGIALPGKGEKPSAPVYVNGKKTVTLHGDHIADQFKVLIEQYVQHTY